MIRSAALVLLVAFTATAVGCKKQPAAPDDITLAQGEWTIVSVESPDVAPGEERELNQLKEQIIIVSGDLVTVSHPKEKGGIAATFALDPAKTPRECDATNVIVTAEGPGVKLSGITSGLYKFEGDELVVALPLGKGKNLPRPTEFKAHADKENDRGVFVFHLKRK